MQAQLMKSRLFSIILLEGFVTVSLEILAIRQLIPFVGNNVIVTSLIIGTFLLFLAIGYWRGGVHTENFYAVLQRNFYIASVITVIGLAYIFLDIFFASLDHFFHLNTIYSLIIYLLLIIAPLIYILGQTVPITMNLVKEEKVVGKIGGKVLFISTVGSFFGSILTSLLLMEFFGVAATLVFNCTLLLILIFILSKSKQNLLLNCALLPLLFAIGYTLNISFEKQNFIATNNYANYSVVPSWHSPETGTTGKIFVINNSWSSFLDKKKQGFSYINKIRKILFTDLKIKNKNILVIGAGGFSLSANGAHDNNLTYIDIDPNIKKIALSHFLNKVRGNFIGEDARIFLKKNKKHYDVILSDVYSNTITIPPSLLTIEYFKQIRKTLTKNGIAVFNIIADPLLRDTYSKRVDNTIRAVFDNCAANPRSYNTNKTNVIYVCKKGKTEKDRKIYSDNLNSATLDSFNS